MAVKLNTAGETHLKALIDDGKYNTQDAWDFSGDDGDALLGASGDNWDRYASVHLGVDDGETDKTKAHWKYPAAKADGDGEQVFRAGLIAAKDRAAQEGATDIADAADRLIKAIDDAEGDDGTSAAVPAEPQPVAAIAIGDKRRAVRDLPRLMTRIFGTPLMIAPEKLDVILGALGPRLGLNVLTSDKQADAFAAMFDDDEDDDGSDGIERKPYETTEDGIALVGVDGTLVYKSSWLGALSGLTGYGDIRASLDAALADPAVKGILLLVDSYGGEVNGCFDLSDAIFAARGQKPIYGVAADDSYSAAFAVLSACSQVFVSRTSGVGSVGVVALHVDMSAADKMDGLKYTYVYSGDRKIDGNPHSPLSAQAQEAIQAECDRLRQLFAASIAKYRGLSVDAVLATQAACYHGELAVAAKFADAMGTPDDAVAALRTELGKRAATTAAVPSAVSLAPPAPVPVEASVPTPKGEVVDLNSVRDRAVGDAAALHAEIVNLCALAGQPTLASEFITSRVGLDQVRARLQDARAHASDARPIRGHILADAGENSPHQAQAGWDSAIRATRGKLKGE